MRCHRHLPILTHLGKNRRFWFSRRLQLNLSIIILRIIICLITARLFLLPLIDNRFFCYFCSHICICRLCSRIWFILPIIRHDRPGLPAVLDCHKKRKNGR